MRCLIVQRPPAPPSRPWSCLASFGSTWARPCLATYLAIYVGLLACRAICAEVSPRKKRYVSKPGDIHGCDDLPCFDVLPEVLGRFLRYRVLSMYESCHLSVMPPQGGPRDATFAKLHGVVQPPFCCLVRTRNFPSWTESCWFPAVFGVSTSQTFRRGSAWTA